MSIDNNDIENIANLARLHLDAGEKQQVRENISNILNLIDQMQSQDTDAVAPLAHAFDAVQRLRPDVVTEKNDREYLQEIAPLTEDGLYLVPRVIE